MRRAVVELAFGSQLSSPGMAGAHDREVAPPGGVDVSIVLPCLDEAETVGICVAKARGSASQLGLRHEVIVADNGSSDGSREIAAGAGRG